MRYNKKLGLEKIAFPWGAFMNGLAAGQTLGNGNTPQLFDNNANSLRLKPLEEIEKNNKDNAIAGGLSAAVIAGAYGLPYLYSTALPAVSTYAMAHPTIAAGVGAAGTALSKGRHALNFARKAYSMGGPRLWGLARATVHPIEQTSAAINAFRTAPASSVASTISTGLSLNALNDAYQRVDEDFITPIKTKIYPHFRDEVYPMIKDKVYPMIKDMDINWYDVTKDYIWPFTKEMCKELTEISKAKARSRKTGEPISSSSYADKDPFRKTLWDGMTKNYRERKSIPYPSVADEFGVENPLLSYPLNIATKGHLMTGPLAYMLAWKEHKERGIPYWDALSDQMGQQWKVNYLKHDNELYTEDPYNVERP